MLPIKSTYKSPDTEETLDIYFYRPIGYGIAMVGRSLRLTPNIITAIGSLIGIVAGRLFLYANLRLNLAGIVLLLVSEAMDSADGQLARITGKYSMAGRIIDGIGGNLIFGSIYFHITLRLIGSSQAWWLFGVALLSILSHSTQCAIADYFRISYLHYVVDPTRGELEPVQEIKKRYDTISWAHSFFDKLIMRLYLNYAVQQDAFVGTFRKLFLRVSELYSTNIPEWFRESYKKKNISQIKYYNILTTNTRMIVLIVSLLIQHVWLYFAFELIVLNSLLAYVVWKQRIIGEALVNELDEEGAGQ